ncbi:hypothetical protein [Actinomadura rupiterrae]|uniref:hypothetical protein n=1 Tax=Actinomadura rupiterrae TaxID=559627 RepID=UPI0020A5FF96|nr:hypothetical protein [Actinomadura rupiterrae]MCP2339144.1 hypothetical protein [Actinomadura rupiterrae]
MSDTDLDPSRIPELLEACDELGRHAPSLYFVLSALGSVASICEDNVPAIWEETSELRRGERVTAIHIIGLGHRVLRDVLAEIEMSGANSEAMGALEEATEMCGELSERLAEAAAYMRTAPARS